MLKLGKIESPSFYMETAMKSMEKHASREKDEIEKKFNKNPSIQKKDLQQIKLDKRKDLELYKVDFLNKKLSSYLKKITKNFPDPTQLEKIYQDLIDTSEVPTTTIREKRRDILKLIHLIDEKTLNTERKIKYAKTQKTLNYIINKHFGKIQKTITKYEESFSTLEKARKFVKSLPKFEDIFTVAIAGYPNVGKSTLMQKLTGSPVEVQHYPFTTKGLMFSYINYHDSKAIQLIDTPGLLQRDKKNNIEKRASLVLTDFSSQIIFVIDFTESCGYSVEKQISLLKEIREGGKKIQIYISKYDVFTEHAENKLEEYKDSIKEFQQYTDQKELRDAIIDDYLKDSQKLDPRKIKTIK